MVVWIIDLHTHLRYMFIKYVHIKRAISSVIYQLVWSEAWTPTNESPPRLYYVKEFGIKSKVTQR